MNVSQLLIRQILKNPVGLDWSLQGFGMLRLYLNAVYRLHIWHSAYAVPNVSTIHTHPWDFISEVIVGRIINHRYSVSVDPNFGEAHRYATIKCGPGGGLTTHERNPINLIAHRYATIKCGPGDGLTTHERNPINLIAHPPEYYSAEKVYTQTFDEIHRTTALDGTVTLVRRMVKGDPDHAKVFWPDGEEWVSAEPRPAKPTEILAFTETALKLFDA